MDHSDVTFTVIDDDGDAETSARERNAAVVVELQPGLLLRATAEGRLVLCDSCKRYTWKCDKMADGTTWCTRVCVSWTCRVVPAGGEIGRLLSNT